MVGVTLAVVLGSPASAQGGTPASTDTSTAYGIAATGPDGLKPQPEVSSDGAAVSKTGDVSNHTFTASGISVTAAAGSAKSTVESLTINAADTPIKVGEVSATCSQGKVTYGRTGSSQPTSNVRVVYGDGAGATITILGAGNKTVATITDAVATCGTGTPPTTQPTTQPTGQPTGKPTNPPTSTPTRGRTGTHTPTRPVQPAPLPTPHEGSGPTVPHVTG